MIEIGIFAVLIALADLIHEHSLRAKAERDKPWIDALRTYPPVGVNVIVWEHFKHNHGLARRHKEDPCDWERTVRDRDITYWMMPPVPPRKQQ